MYSGLKGRGEKADYGAPSLFGLADKVPVVLDGKEIGRIRVKDILP